MNISPMGINIDDDSNNKEHKNPKVIANKICIYCFFKIFIIKKGP